MSEPSLVRRMRREVKVKTPEPTVKELPCPVCGRNTVNRTVDGKGWGGTWYVEWCNGGVLKFREVIRDAQGGVTEEIIHEFDCPYWWAGWM